MSLFANVPLAPPDPILGLTAAYLADTRGNKVNMGVGYYRDENLRTPILDCVKEAEKVLLESEPNKEYLAIDGHRGLIDRVGELVFGTAFWQKQRHRIAGFQMVGGTSGLRIGGAFCHEISDAPLFLPAPSWPNHRGVFVGCHEKVLEYPYYDFKTHQLKFDSMCTFFKEQKEGSVVLLQASCHNPTGCDPSFEQWKELYEVLRKNKCIPFFDLAYQGFGEGLDEDAQAVRLFAEKGCEMFVTFSAAKNFSLYAERVGALFIVTENAQCAEHVASRVRQIIRTHYSNPPKHGAAVVAYILSEPDLKKKWLEELKQMRQRIANMKRELVERLSVKSEKFRHMRDGKGMFCYTGLQKNEVELLIAEYGIYMPPDGRVNVCGLNKHNLDYVAEAILKT